MITKIGLYRDPRKEKQWVVRWYGEYDPTSGKQNRYSKSFKLKRDAEEFQSQKAMEFKEGKQRDKADEITLKVFCDDWLNTKKPVVRSKTCKAYGDTINRLIDHFGSKMVLCKVTPRLAAQFIAIMQRIDNTNKDELSNWTRGNVLRNCKIMFNTAVDWELISKNPFNTVGTPKLSTKRWHYLKPTEYKRLLKVAPALRWKALYALAYTAGLRFGELFSLTWKDIDFEKGEVRIENRPATSTNPPFDVKDHEARRIPLPKHTLDILTELQAHAPERVPYILLNEQLYRNVVAKWRKYQQEKRAWENQDMANNVLREFKRHLKWVGIKPNGSLAIHTLRKCCGQNWADCIPNPNVVKELMGHSSLATTMKFYNQVNAEHRAEAAALIDDLLTSPSDAETTGHEKTDARLTPEGNFELNREKGQV